MAPFRLFDDQYCKLISIAEAVHACRVASVHYLTVSGSIIDELYVNVFTLYREFGGSPTVVLLHGLYDYVTLITYHVMC